MNSKTKDPKPQAAEKKDRGVEQVEKGQQPKPDNINPLAPPINVQGGA
ncbi:hypothetical protein [Sphingomonas sp. C3-2]|nr:hypothetical protein [Sphingomonas sp. C3-2]WOK35310.1 hypothetical protein QYC26_09730 [Sphingomonas sp. C3-2]